VLPAKEGMVLQGMTDRLKLDDVVGGVGSERGKTKR
jgi:hypothetical protein